MTARYLIPVTTSRAPGEANPNSERAHDQTCYPREMRNDGNYEGEREQITHFDNHDAVHAEFLLSTGA